jgi:hypothetical protein
VEVICEASFGYIDDVNYLGKDDNYILIVVEICQPLKLFLMPSSIEKRGIWWVQGRKCQD